MEREKINDLFNGCWQLELNKKILICKAKYLSRINGGFVTNCIIKVFFFFNELKFPNEHYKI